MVDHTKLSFSSLKKKDGISYLSQRFRKTSRCRLVFFFPSQKFKRFVSHICCCLFLVFVFSFLTLKKKAQLIHLMAQPLAPLLFPCVVICINVPLGLLPLNTLLITAAAVASSCAYVAFIGASHANYIGHLAPQLLPQVAAPIFVILSALSYWRNTRFAFLEILRYIMWTAASARMVYDVAAPAMELYDGAGALYYAEPMATSFGVAVWTINMYSLYVRRKIEKVEAESAASKKLMDKWGVAATIARSLKEDPNKDVNSFYDLVIITDCVPDVMRLGGWPIRGTHPRETLETKYHALKVGVVGRFGVGKSFVLAHVCNVDLPTGELLSTEGLSVKVCSLNQRGTTKGSQILLFDTKGTETPVINTDPSTGEAAAPEDMEQRLQEAKVSEDFLRHIVLQMSDVYLFVVGQMSYKDQIDLFLLCKAVSLSKQQHPTIIVVHNLRNVSQEQIERCQYSKKIKDLYNLREVGNDVVGGVLTYLQGQMFANGARAQQRPVDIVHFFLTRADADADKRKNALVFERLRAYLLTRPYHELTIQQDFKKAVQSCISQFLAVGSDPVNIATMELGVTKDGKGFGANKPIGADVKVTARHRSLGNFVSMAIDSLPYNVSRVKIQKKRQAKGFIETTLAIVTIEVPGQIPETPETRLHVLVSNPMNMEGVVRIEVKTRLLNVPDSIKAAMIADLETEHQLSAGPQAVVVDHPLERAIPEQTDGRDVIFIAEINGIRWNGADYTYHTEHGVLCVGLVEIPTNPTVVFPQQTVVTLPTKDTTPAGGIDAEDSSSAPIASNMVVTVSPGHGGMLGKGTGGNELLF